MHAITRNFTAYRTHTCGELKFENVKETVVLCGWVQRSRKMGGMVFIDLRDRYGITQIAFSNDTDAELCEKASKLGREFVISVKGEVIERESKNLKIATGEIEILANELTILNESATPPFTIEDESDGGDELRMKYRYLDLRRQPLHKNLLLRSQLGQCIREYLTQQNFLEVETPFLIKSTPEGARDFVVPSRMNENEFYALPQSPQVFKQLLMTSGYDRYFQVVKCFRDEDLRADRQPEFTQLDCEMAFVKQDDVLNMFEGLVKHSLYKLKDFKVEGAFPRMSWHDAMANYGSDKPDIRFGMEINDITSLVQDKGFKVFDDAEYVGAISVEGAASYSRKQLDALTKFVQQEQIGAKGLVYVKYNEDGSFKSSVDKFYSAEELAKWAETLGANKGDLLLVLCGNRDKTLVQLGELRLEMGRRLELMDPEVFKPLWVVDFPLMEWSEEKQRFHAMHHPFTAPKEEDINKLDSDLANVRANAYDCVINGVELGGGSERIFDSELQNKIFKSLGFTDEEAKSQFGFLMEAFKYGAPPHAGIAFGFDRWVALLAGLDSIRDTIAFPKNNSGRDVMIDAPSKIAKEQLEELKIDIIESAE
jgi:aspartyl-tRNA synthetase